jgi:enamine deaminase RidA (YjgF/YER057c/UK114 family)
MKISLLAFLGLSLLTWGSIMNYSVAGEITEDEIYVPHKYEYFYNTLHFSPVTRAGNTIYFAGVVGLNPDLKTIVTDEEQQYRAAFQMLADFLKASGAKFSDVVDITTFHVPGTNRALFAKVKNEFMQGPAYPAWTAVTVAELSFGAKVEIKAVAVRSWDPTITKIP